MGTITLTSAIHEVNEAALTARLLRILTNSALPLYHDPSVAKAATAADQALRTLALAMGNSDQPTLNPASRPNVDRPPPALYAVQ